MIKLDGTPNKCKFSFCKKLKIAMMNIILALKCLLYVQMCEDKSSLAKIKTNSELEFT